MLSWLRNFFAGKPHTHQWEQEPGDYLQVCAQCGVIRWVLWQAEYDGYLEDEADTD